MNPKSWLDHLLLNNKREKPCQTSISSTITRNFRLHSTIRNANRKSTPLTSNEQTTNLLSTSYCSTKHTNYKKQKQLLKPSNQKNHSIACFTPKIETTLKQQSLSCGLEKTINLTTAGTSKRLQRITDNFTAKTRKAHHHSSSPFKRLKKQLKKLYNLENHTINCATSKEQRS